MSRSRKLALPVCLRVILKGCHVSNDHTLFSFKCQKLNALKLTTSLLLHKILICRVNFALWDNRLKFKVGVICSNNSHLGAHFGNTLILGYFYILSLPFLLFLGYGEGIEQNNQIASTIFLACKLVLVILIIFSLKSYFAYAQFWTSKSIIFAPNSVSQATNWVNRIVLASVLGNHDF